MSSFAVLKLEYSACVEELTEALRTENETAFFAAVDHMLHMREPGMVSQLRSVAGDLQQALQRFSIESRLHDLATNEIPDARARLRHVISLTDQAAHRTLDLVEQSGPLADRLAREAAGLTELLARYHARPDTAQSADLPTESTTRRSLGLLPLLQTLDEFLPAARTDAERIRRNLADMLLAQGYQDLTGQIIRSVMTLVEELEVALARLTKLAGGDLGQQNPREQETAGAFGPVVPGVTNGEVASGQTDVDALLSDLGM
jgi:chemotaxis protein CheZ